MFLQVIKTLARYGADLALKNDNGDTLLHSLILQSAQRPDRSDYVELFDCVWEATSILADQHMAYSTKNAQQRSLEQKQQQVGMG